ncbi:MAG TPA: hypothetical protein VH257_11620 [Chloroflexota bacterium]|jgi:tetratricopeptide (TPR) repeat protein|nr:hypothetical protein [Chloroflexota bacterium]
MVTESAECAEQHDQASALGREAHALIRARDYAAAGPVLERALALDPESAMLAHAKAHLCIDSGAFQEGAAFLRPYLRDHDPFEGVNVHTAWHLAYIELELGRPAEALDWHRRVVAPTLSPMTYSSAVSLIWRMEVAGSGGPHLRPDWELLHAFDPGLEATSHLDEIARAMTCFACADAPGLAGVQARGGAAARQDAVAGEVVLPLIEALHAFWEGDYAGAAGRLEALAPSLGRLSEFPDQLGVFQETQRRARALAGA